MVRNIILSTFFLSCISCSKIEQSKQALESNRIAIEMSTKAINENALAIEEANKSIAENRRQLQEINEALKKAKE